MSSLLRVGVLSSLCGLLLRLAGARHLVSPRVLCHLAQEQARWQQTPAIPCRTHSPAFCSQPDVHLPRGSTSHLQATLG